MGKHFVLGVVARRERKTNFCVFWPAVHQGKYPRGQSSQQIEARLATENRSLEHIGQRGEVEIGPRAQASIRVCGQTQIDRDFAKRSLSRNGDITARRYRRLVIKVGKRLRG